MKSALAALAAVSTLASVVQATPVYNPLEERFEYAPLGAPAGFSLEKRADNTTLPDANTLSSVFKAPVADGGKAWKDAYERTKAIVAQMTLQEKVDVVTGQTGRCAGNTGAVDRLNIPTLLQDGPAGPRPAQGKSQMPAEVTVAATWDRDLIYQRAYAMGKEFYDLGVHVALAPVTGGPLGRAARGGRNWEGLTADPYSSGVGSYYSVKGIQDAGVAATAKHYIAYEQETMRNAFVLANTTVFGENGQLPIDSILDDKTTHELYLWSFAEAVRAGTGYTMCSYNMVNGTHACSNSISQNKLLKTELNFQGAIMSDWGGTWGTVPFAEGGLDLEMPGKGYGGILGTWFDDNLLQAVQNGTLPESRVDDQVIRTLTPYFALGQADNALPSVAINNLHAAAYGDIYRLVQQENTVALIKKIGEDSAVLLKNEGALPLKAPQRITIIGQGAGPNVLGYQTCGDTGTDCPIDNNNGTLTCAFGSGWSSPQNLVTPLCAISDRASKDRSMVKSVLNNTAIEDIQTAVTDADVALVFVEVWATEGLDRLDLNLTTNGNAIVEAAAAYNNNTIVIMNIPGPVVIDSWVEHPNITAILAPLLPGEQAGNSLVSVLYGDVSPSGKLPFTIGKSESDYLPNSIVTDVVVAPKSYFNEGVNIDYRWFDSQGIEPRYEFGYGLSYSTFDYSNIYVKSTYKADDQAVQETNETFKGQEDGESLYDTIATVYAEVTNSGDVVACEVAQLYVEFPSSEDQPPRQMRGFEKLKQLSPGQTKTAAFPIRRKDVMVWDTVLQKWRKPDGSVTFHVGSSSRKLNLSATYDF